MSASLQLDAYLRAHEKGLDTVSKAKLNRDVYKHTNHSDGSLEQSLIYFMEHLKSVQKFRSAQLKQVTKLLAMEMDIDDEMNLCIASPNLDRKTLSDEEFESYLLGCEETPVNYNNENNFTVNNSTSYLYSNNNNNDDSILPLDEIMQLNKSFNDHKIKLRHMRASLDANSSSSSRVSKNNHNKNNNNNNNAGESSGLDNLLGIAMNKQPNSQQPEPPIEVEEDNELPPPPPPPLEEEAVPSYLVNNSARRQIEQQMDVASEVFARYQQTLLENQRVLDSININSNSAVKCSESGSGQQHVHFSASEVVLESPCTSPKPTTPSFTPSFTDASKASKRYEEHDNNNNNIDNNSDDDDEDYWNRTSNQQLC